MERPVAGEEGRRRWWLWSA